MKDGGPAFPRPATYERHAEQDGMSLRDYFAAKAMAAMAGAICEMHEDGIIRHRPADVAQIAYVYADAMLAEREK